MNVENEAKKMFQQWQKQQQLASNNYNTQSNRYETTDQSPHLNYENLPTTPDQTPPNPTNSVRPMGIKNKSSQPIYENPNACPQCGTLHPPLRQNEKCPNASPITAKEKSTGINDDFLREQVVSLRNIILSQLSLKKIKDGKKFFQYAIIELTKALERYIE